VDGVGWSLIVLARHDEGWIVSQVRHSAVGVIMIIPIDYDYDSLV
jgi:hypothetical protein